MSREVIDIIMKQNILAERIAALREYVDVRFDENKHKDAVTAIELARRLDILNHAHEQATKLQETYVSREVFDIANERLGALEQWQSKVIGMGALLLTLIGIGTAFFAWFLHR